MEATFYTWDQNKYEINLKRHGLKFEDAVRLYDSGTLQAYLVFVPGTDGKLEMRDYGIGELDGVLYVVIDTPVAGTKPLRIISFRKARKNECEAYRAGTFYAHVQAYQRGQDARYAGNEKAEDP